MYYEVIASYFLVCAVVFAILAFVSKDLPQNKLTKKITENITWASLVVALPISDYMVLYKEKGILFSILSSLSNAVLSLFGASLVVFAAFVFCYAIIKGTKYKDISIYSFVIPEQQQEFKHLLQDVLNICASIVFFICYIQFSYESIK